jgi:hypothetical protein
MAWVSLLLEKRRYSAISVIRIEWWGASERTTMMA